MNEFLRNALFLPKQASTISKDIDHLHFWVIGFTMAGATIAAVTALWFTYKYRRRMEGELTPRVQAGLISEFGVLSFLLALFLVFWIVGYKQFIRIRTPPKDAMVVYVTGKQWMWKFAYPEGRSTIATLVVPVNQKVKLIMTSRDVIHSFFVPAFRLKHDVLPGRYDTLWFEAVETGLYKVFCAEYCGLNHSQMWADVLVLEPEEFNLWMEGAPTEDIVNFPPGKDRALVASHERPQVDRAPFALALRGRPQSMADRGKLVAERKGCLACHTLDGQRHIGPTWRGLWNKIVTLDNGEQVVADEKYLTRSMMDPMVQIVAGFAPVMPTYQGLLEPAEIGALLELIRSLEAPLPAEASYPSPLTESPVRPPQSHVDPQRAQRHRDLPSEGSPP